MDCSRCCYCMYYRDISNARRGKEASMDTKNNLRMKVAHVAADLSQADLAAAVGAPRQMIGLIEAGGLKPYAQTMHYYLQDAGCHSR